MKGWSLYVESNCIVDPDDWEEVVYDYAEWLSRKLGMKVLVNRDAVEQMKEFIAEVGLNVCPCSMIIQPSTLCPCALALSDLRNRGTCMCGLYYLAPEDMQKLQERGTSLLNEALKEELEV